MTKYTRSAKKTSRRQTMIIGIVSLVILGLVVIAALALQPAASTETPTAVGGVNRVVEVQEAYNLYQEGVFTLDVRTSEEYQAGHIPGAALIPLNELADRSGELPRGEPILIYCRSGNRSLQALNLLESAGFQGLASVDGGFSEWVAVGYPVEYP